LKNKEIKMQNILILVLASIVSSCSAYETLSTPVDFILGKDEEKLEKMKLDENYNQRQQGIAAGTYEITVTAPQGTLMNTAVDMFHEEAEKLCEGQNYQHKIISQGMTEEIEYQRQGQITNSVPTLVGQVTCYK
jgi:hypothetical protein